MVIGVISDTHHRKLPEECVERLKGADAILHGGDFTAREDLEALQQLGPPVHAVRGNGDDSWLVAKLPLMRTVEFEGVQIGLIHDAGPAKGRLQPAAQALSRRARGGLRPLAHPAARDLRGLRDLQPGLADRPPPGAAATRWGSPRSRMERSLST